MFRDIVHPISPLARKQFEEVILEAYQRQLVMIEAEEKAAQAETLTAQAEQESSDALTDIYKILADADPGQSAE